MALKVIGAGLGRTGTFSLKFALEYLGFGPCHHMTEVMANPDQLPKWIDVVNGKPGWDSVFDGFSSAVDYPVCTYWRELMDFYPDAKFILTVRDAESWFGSVNSTIFSEIMLERMMWPATRAFFEGAVYRDFPDTIGDREFMVDYFPRRNAEVIATIPAERLLVYEAGDGWEPLCAFLGVTVPEVPYPRVNSREEMMPRILSTIQEAEAASLPTPEQRSANTRAYIDGTRDRLFGSGAAGTS